MNLAATPQKKLHLLVLAGGRSPEHEVSLSSARSVVAALKDSAYLSAEVCVLNKEGTWLSLEESKKVLERGPKPQDLPVNYDPEGAGPAHLGHAQAGGGAEGMMPHKLGLEQIAQLNFAAFDAVFPLIHGNFGEDGKLQGFLELLDVPYIGAGVLGSSLCMDKPLTKDVLRSHHLPVGKYLYFPATMLEHQEKEIIESCCRNLKAPWFVKPANAGSSIGITKVKKVEDLGKALRLACKYDRRFIVEEGIEHARELEVGVVGNEEPEASVVGELTYTCEFYDYAAKYQNDQAKMVIPAPLPAGVSERVRELAVRAFKVLDGAGLARVDFFYVEEGDLILINELNTLPGFTTASMFPYLWQASGLPYEDLLYRLATLAQERYRAVKAVSF